MTNLDEHPVPEQCEAGGDGGGFELLLPREVPLGGPRAMPVQRALPNRPRHLIGAWCFVDTFGPVDLASRPGMAVDPHPHTGLQTVSWLAAGEVEHRDSVGSFDLVVPGGVAIMTAGHGISHSEYTPHDHSPTLHGVQLWIVLPSGERDRAPMFEGIAEVPSAVVRASANGGGDDPTVGMLAPGVVSVASMVGSGESPDAALEISTFVGEFHGLCSDATVFTPLVGVGLRPTGAVRASLRLEDSFEHGVIAMTPGVRVEGIEVPVGGIGYLPVGTALAEVELDESASATLIGGEPFDETFVMFWNFIAPGTEAVRAARAVWQDEREAALDPAARPRFGVVAGHGDVTLPSPEKPGVPLRPRGRVSAPRAAPSSMVGERGPRNAAPE